MPSELTLSLHPRIADIPAEDWDACDPTENPFTSHAFLLSMEESGCTGPRTG